MDLPRMMAEHDAGHRWLRETFLSAISQVDTVADNVTRLKPTGTAARGVRPRSS